MVCTVSHLLERASRRPTGSGSRAAPLPLLLLDRASRPRRAARPVDWCVTDGCSASSWFSRKIFQFECWITRKQIGTTSTSPSGARSHMSSKAILASPSNSSERRPVGRQAREHEAAVALDARCALHVAVGVVPASAACPRSPWRAGSRCSCRRGGSSRSGRSR